MTLPSSAKLKVIGWREYVALPALGLAAIKAKVDSGAATSALHATNVRYGVDDDGAFVTFAVVASVEPRRVVRARAPLVARRMVRSSSGHGTLRPVVRLDLALGGETWPIEVTLVNRDPMGFRMLIGRRALRGRFLIHPARSFLVSETR